MQMETLNHGGGSAKRIRLVKRSKRFGSQRKVG